MAREVVRKRRQNDGAAGQKTTKEAATVPVVDIKENEETEIDFNKDQKHQEEKHQEENQIPSSVGKIPSTRQSRKHQNRASLQAAPYANLLSTTPGKNNTVINSPRTPLRTPRSATTKRQDLWDIGSPLSPKSPSMRALNAIVSFISPYASARRSAAFGEPEEEHEEEAQGDRSAIWKGKQKEDSSALMEEDEDENDEEDIASSLYPPLPSDPNSSIQAIEKNDLEDDTTIIEQTIDEIEEEDDDDDSSKEGEDEPSNIQTQDGQREGPREADAVSIGKKIESPPIVVTKDKPSSRAFSFMSAIRPEPSFGASSAIGLAVSEEQPIQDNVEISGAKNSFSLPAARSPFQSNGFIAPRQSTPSRTGFGAIASEPIDSTFKTQPAPQAQEAPRSSVIPPSGAFTFGVSQEATTSRLPQYPRMTRSAKTISPLAKNYELLARFFAEKAEQEARAEASTSISSMDEDGNEQTGALTEIEVAGCMRLIEQSYAHGQGEEIERLRHEALRRGQAPQVRGDDSIENRMDEDEVHFANSHITQNRRQFISRSPSLPLGAAAGEDPVAGLYGYRSQPSNSFLAPTYRDPQDLRVNQSLANIFGNSATVPPKRKHRPLYLGPGVGASATSAILRRTQQMQGRRSALTMQRTSLRDQLRPLPMRRPAQNEIAEEPEDSEGPRKRRKLPEDSVVNKQIPELAESNPSTNSKAKQQNNVQPPTQSPAIRTATADAMLSILNSGPSIPSRAPASANHSRTSTTGNSEAESTSNPDLINPYETRSRLTRRSVIPTSSNAATTAAAKEKDRLKEEREKRLKAQKEREARKESTLDFIKRTAPSPQIKRGRQIRLEEDDEEEAEAEAEEAEREAQKASAEADAKEKAKAAEETRKRKNEELKRRMEKMNKDAQVKNASADNAETKLSAQPTSSNVPASKSFTFNSGFAPKKPSPLSQAASNQIPDSPSASSESSERSHAKPILSPDKVSTGPHSSSTIVIDDEDEEVTRQEPKTNAPVFNFASREGSSSDTSKSGSGSAPAFSFTTTTTKAGPSSTSPATTSAPFSFNKPAEVQKPNASTISSVPASASDEPTSDRAKAEKAPVTSLPKFDFTLDVVLPNASDMKNEAARETVSSESIESLPKFDFGESVIAESPAPVAASKTFSFSAPKPAANASSTPSFSFKPVPSATSAVPSMNKDAGETSAEPGAGATSGEDSTTVSEKTKSALLSGMGEGEEDENTMHEVRCKIWNLSDGKWNDLGIGFLKIKKNKSTSKQRVLVRNEGNGKVTVNFNILSTFKPSQEKNIVTFLGFDQTGKPTNYRCKIKTEQDAKELKDSLEKSAKEVS